MSLNIAELEFENERLSSENQGNNFLQNFVKLPEGNGHIVLRLLPPIPANKFGNPKQVFYQSTRTHKVNGKSFHCPCELDKSKRWVGDCPICKYYKYLWQESEKKSADEAQAMQAQARAIKPVERYYYNAIVRKQFNADTGAVEENVGPKIWSMGKTTHKMIIRAIIGDRDLDEKPLGDVTDVKSGRDFKLIKAMRQSGKASYPSYGESKFLDPSPLGTPEEIEKWMSELHDLTTLRSIKPNEELKKQLKMHLGVIADDSTGFDPTEFQRPNSDDDAVTTVREETGARGDAAPPKTAATRAVVENEDEDEAMADDDFLKQLQDM